MPEYKLYILKDNDRVIDVVRIDCVSDAEAINLLDGGSQRHALEVWQGNRFLGRARRATTRAWQGAAALRPQFRAEVSSTKEAPRGSPTPRN